jgi:hypothetical protein
MRPNGKQGSHFLEVFFEAISRAQDLKTRKGSRSWRQFITKQGVNVYGRPMPDHQPRAFTDIGAVPVIVVDNSIPESTQDIALVQQYLHLELGHSPETLNGEQDVATVAGALMATMPADGPELDDYFEENPGVQHLLIGLVVLAVIRCLVNRLLG